MIIDRTELTKIGTWQGKDLYLHPIRDKSVIEAFAYLGHELEKANEYIEELHMDVKTSKEDSH